MKRKKKKERETKKERGRITRFVSFEKKKEVGESHKNTRRSSDLLGSKRAIT